MAALFLQRNNKSNLDPRDGALFLTFCLLRTTKMAQLTLKRRIKLEVCKAKRVLTRLQSTVNDAPETFQEKYLVHESSQHFHHKVLKCLTSINYTDEMSQVNLFDDFMRPERAIQKAFI